MGRLSAIWAANDDTVMFKYDAGGRLVEKWFPNDVTARYAYNADNSLQQVVNRSSSSTIISRHDYTYDGVGNRLTHTERIGGSTTSYSYLYDALNRLTQVGNGTPAQQENYTYDPLNNRTTKRVNATSPVTTAYVYDAANQLKEIRQNNASGALLASMQYDGNGNMYQKTEGSATTAISYDALNRVAGVTKTGLHAQSYKYDDQGRRISKTVVGVTTNYLYNGPDIYGEYSDWAEAAAIYTHGPNMDDPIIRETGTATQYFHQDGLGSVVALSDQEGAQVGTQRFDAWGNRLAGTGTIPQYGYTGREPDETGLVYYRARYYDPSIGRFTQRDPVGLQGGINQYAYVDGNPVIQTDPEGLLPIGSVQVADNSYFSNYGTDAGGTSVGSKLLQGTHYALDAVNLFANEPAAPFGAIAGAIDAGIYWLEGKKVDAGLSLGGVIPGIGIAATAGRYGGKAVDAVRGGVQTYEVGTASALKVRSVAGDALDIHHVGQAHPLEQLVSGYNRATGPAIALPVAEHGLIPTVKGAITMTPRGVLATDIRNLRNFTNAPNTSLQDLIRLNKEMYPEVFAK